MISASSIALNPLLTYPLLIALIAPALLLTCYAALRRTPGSLWRLLLTFVLTAILLNPSLVTEQRTLLRDVALIVVDHSPSQQLGNRPAQTSRALKALQAKLAALPNLDVRVIDSSTGGDETKLFTLADQTLADVPENRRAGLLLISDGQVHDVPAPASASHYGPVHLLLTGSAKDTDRRLTIINAPGYGIVGQSVTATVRVEDLPNRQSDTATLTLHHEDGSSESKEVRVGEDVEITLPVSHAGLNLLSMDVNAPASDITSANNRAALMVNGIRDRLRVLLVSGMPHNGERVWRNLLKSDPAVDLVHFTILRSTDKRDFAAQSEVSLIPFPVHELFMVKLRKFDLVIFDRFNDSSILAPAYLINIAQYIRSGGAVLDATGTDLASPDSLANSPLAGLLPSTPNGETSRTPFSPKVTVLGLRHPITSSLPGLNNDGSGTWGNWLGQSDVSANADSQVLMEGAQQQPLLLLNQAGDGRVAQLTSEQIWLWSRGYGRGGPHVELLRPLVHWLMKEPELEPERLTADTAESVLHVTRHSLKADEAPVEVTLPDGQKATIKMTDNGRQATGQLAVSQPGIYRLTDGTRHTLALVGRPDAPELRDQRATAQPLEPLITQTRGGAFWLEDMEDGPSMQRVRAGQNAAGRSWAGLADNGNYSVNGFNTRTLLPELLAAILALAAALTAWRRESR